MTESGVASNNTDLLFCVAGAQKSENGSHGRVVSAWGLRMEFFPSPFQLMLPFSRGLSGPNLKSMVWLVLSPLSSIFSGSS